MTMAEAPASVGRLITLNREFAVFLCSNAHCRHALTVEGMGEQLRKFHAGVLPLMRGLSFPC